MFKKKEKPKTDFELGRKHAMNSAWAVYAEYEYIDGFNLPTMHDVAELFAIYNVEKLVVRIPEFASDEFVLGAQYFIDWLEAAVSSNKGPRSIVRTIEGNFIL